MSAHATDLMEQARDKVQQFLNAKRREEVVFVHGTTHGINLVANAYAKAQLTEGDEIIVSEMEHHANIVPWQMLEQDIGIKVVVC